MATSDFQSAEAQLRQALLEPPAAVVQALVDRIYKANLQQTCTRIKLAIVVHFPSDKKTPWFLVDPEEYDSGHRPRFARYDTAAPPRLLAAKELSAALLGFEAGYQHVMQIGAWLDTGYMTWYMQQTPMVVVPHVAHRHSFLSRLFGEPEARELTEYVLVLDQALTSRKEQRKLRSYTTKRLVRAAYRQAGPGDDRSTVSTVSRREPSVSSRRGGVTSRSRSTNSSNTDADSSHSSGSESGSFPDSASQHRSAPPRSASMNALPPMQPLFASSWNNKK
jgi:hypothetical protein